MTLSQKVKQFIHMHELIQRGDLIIVGVSGGSDSMCLITLLNTLKHELGCRLHIAHFNHNLRQDSLKDQNCVITFAKDHNIPITTEMWRNPPRDTKGSIEEKARNRRLKFFKKIVKKTNAQAVALAHHSDDVAETLLMRLLRGAGLSGLRGILPKRIIHEHLFIRPLLTASKEEILHFLKTSKIKFTEDQTNKDNTLFRNKVRNKLIPTLKKDYTSNISALLNQTTQILNDDYAYLEQQSDKTFTRMAQCKKNRVVFPRAKIQTAHISLRRMLYRKAVAHLRGDTNALTYTHIQKIENIITPHTQDKKIDLPKQISVTATLTEISFILST